MTITFEYPTPEDAQALVEAQVRAFHSDTVLYPDVEESGPPGYDSVDQMLEDIDKHHVFKIVSEGQIIGGIVVFYRGSAHYHLDRLFVIPEYHNQGIGSQAMQFLDEKYPATKWTLDTPLYADRNQHFYEKFGFVKVNEWIEAESGLRLIAYERRI